MINGANVLDQDELIEHLDRVLTVSWTEYQRGHSDEDWIIHRKGEEEYQTDDRDLQWQLFRAELFRLLRVYDMYLLSGPAHRWTIGESVFYSWPVRSAP